MTKDTKFKPSRKTMFIIRNIRKAIRKAGYEKELHIVPLAKEFSVVVEKENNCYNLRLDKETLEVKETFAIKSEYYNGAVRRVFRKKIRND